MKVLIWKSKHDDVIYLADTEEQNLAAYFTIFEIMDETGDYECCPPDGKRHQQLYDAAKKGDKKAAKRFLQERSSYEYENVFEYDATDPLKVEAT